MTTHSTSQAERDPKTTRGADGAIDAIPGGNAPVDAPGVDLHDDVPVQRYSLTTAVCLIVGICIGSGIFFKSDNILVATGGNIALGALMMLVAATTIVFGGLTLARFAARTTGHGGLITFARRFLSPRWATFIGWHYTFLYMPCVCAVICWVVGVYACLAFGLPGTFPHQMAIGTAFMLACAGWNICWPRLSGYFQNLTTAAKALPLVAVGIVGLVLAHPAEQLAAGIESAPSAGLGWLAAAAPIAFAFDGWSSAVSIAPEIKDTHRNLPRALVIAPIVILVLYLGYFLGLSCFLGPQRVMEAGDASLSLLFVELFGERAAVLPNVIALIAVVGTANGMILATLRMPFALALYDQMPCSRVFKRMNGTLRFPVASALLELAVMLAWVAIHTAVSLLGLIPNGDISEIGVGLTMLVLIAFYAEAMRESLQGAEPDARAARGPEAAPADAGGRSGKPPLARRLGRAAAPALAIASSLAIGISSVSEPARWPFLIAFLAIPVAMAFALNRDAGRRNPSTARAPEAKR